MRVDSSNLHLASSRTFLSSQRRTESVQQWRTTPQVQKPQTLPATPKVDSADLSDQGKALATEPDAKQKQVLEILEKVFGIAQVKSLSLQIDATRSLLTSQSTQQRAQASGGGLAVDYHSSYAEFEQSSLTAQGTFTLDDGRTFKLDLSVQQTRLYVSEQSVSLRAGDAQMSDPIALDLTGGGVNFLDQLAPMDLDGGGSAKQVPRLAGNAKWLVFDKNQDGKVTQDELFGPRSGDGFAELAKLDQDGNGWVDGGDRDFAKLSLWDGVGAPILLASYGVGALSTGSVAAAFDHKDADNTLLARSRAAGLYLRNDGTAGVTRQVDLVA